MSISTARFQIALVLLVLPFLAKAQSYEKEGWDLKKEGEGIFVYTKSVPGFEYKAIKVYANFNTSMSSIIAVLKDVPAYTSWVYICKESNNLKKLSETEEYYFTETAPPWPLRNRDVVVKSTFSQDPVTKIVTSRFVAVEDESYPEVDGLVRIKEMEGEYVLMPQDDGSIDIHYQLKANPAGLLPVWLVNMTIANGPFQSFLKLKTKVSEEKYQRARYDFLEEPKFGRNQ